MRCVMCGKAEYVKTGNISRGKYKGEQRYMCKNKQCRHIGREREITIYHNDGVEEYVTVF